MKLVPKLALVQQDELLYNLYLLLDESLELFVQVQGTQKKLSIFSTHKKVKEFPAFITQIKYQNLAQKGELVLTLGNLKAGKTEEFTCKLGPKLLFNSESIEVGGKTAFLLKIESKEKLSRGEKIPTLSLPKNETVDNFVNYGIDIEQKANFKSEIDLHFEKLVSNPKSFAPHEIIGIQINRAMSYLHKANELDLSPVYLICGIGEGRLRIELTNRLQNHPIVESVNNSYHPKYGNGALEVYLR